MKDTVLLGSGNSRYLKSVANFLSLYPTYNDFVAALVAGTLPVDFNGVNAAGCAQVGTSLSKANLLTDATASALGLSGNDPTINEALAALAGKQDALTIDATPTNGSNNPVSSDGVYDMIMGRTKLYTASCATAAATAAKVATLDDSTGFSLTVGVMVAVRFTYGNSAATPTLRVDGSTAGTAKTIAIPSSATEFTTGNGTTYNTWGARETILFTYTGTYWVHLPSGYLGYLAYNLANGKQAAINVSGLLKGDGSGGVSAGVAGTDYQAPLPAQSGNSGKYLSTNGSALSWAAVSVPGPSSASPQMDGTAAAGSSGAYARADHVHPSDTAKQNAISASGVLQGDGSGNISAKAVDTTVSSASTNLITSGAVYTAIFGAMGGSY